jgi:decaprenylphospho-beta-D-ribofuranose 2-oxidase
VSDVAPAWTQLLSWGRGPATRSLRSQPRSQESLRAALLADNPRGLIPRGSGRSYGDACLNDGGAVADMRGFDYVSSFDESTGDLECGAGVTIAALMQRFLPLGFIPPVCPGTGFVTLGGAIANDAHGKNHHGVGSTGDVVSGFDLLTPDGAQVAVTRESNPELFAATIGGIGLTGIVNNVRMRLQRVPGNAVSVTERRMRDLDEFIEALASAEASNAHTVGWIDSLARGRALGRGVLEVANPVESPARVDGTRRLRIPIDFPSWILNRYSVAAFNELYFRRVPAGGRTRTVQLGRFLFPLDALLDWNRMYGRAGVYQFQCVVPHATAREALRRLMDRATRSGAASFLAVLKTLGRSGSGMLSFPMPGFSLALDFPRGPATAALIVGLHDIAIEHGGRVYLAKDATLTPERFRDMYPRVAEFTAVLRRIDPAGRMRSDMGRRLGLVTSEWG